MSHSRKYLLIHGKIRSDRGLASSYKCECGRPAYDWAHIHNTNPDDISNYVAMCRSCHVKYDGNCRQKGSKHDNAKLTEEDVIEIREMYSTGKWLQKDLCFIFEIGAPQMSDIINYKAWQHV
jgi:hypothetical protein